MAVATEILANKAEIKVAMSELGIDHWVDDLLDEIELQKQLKISIEQDDKGEVFPIEELEKQVMENFANGYYDR